MPLSDYPPEIKRDLGSLTVNEVKPEALKLLETARQELAQANDLEEVDRVQRDVSKRIEGIYVGIQPEERRQHDQQRIEHAVLHLVCSRHMQIRNAL